MGWVLPRTYTTGEVITASIANTHWRDQLRYLKGLDGNITIEANLVTAFNVDGVDVSAHKAGTAKAQHTAGAGDHTHQSAGAEGATIDHGLALTGKGDDDHTQYVLRSILTTEGDLFKRGASVVERFAKGTTAQFLRGDISWQIPPGVTLTVAETEVFTGTSPTSFTDLNLSGTIGSQKTLVILKVKQGVATTTFTFRANGDTDDHSVVPGRFAVNMAYLDANKYGLIIVTTDASGIVEWITDQARTGTTVDIVAYIK